MGISKIYLLGVDFSFDIPKNPSNGDILRCEGEKNHFHPDYRKRGETWTIPRLDLQYKSFSCAKSFSDTHQIKIYNASRKTKLDIFPYIQFEKIFLTK